MDKLEILSQIKKLYIDRHLCQKDSLIYWHELILLSFLFLPSYEKTKFTWFVQATKLLLKFHGVINNSRSMCDAAAKAIASSGS